MQKNWILLVSILILAGLLVVSGKHQPPESQRGPGNNVPASASPALVPSGASSSANPVTSVAREDVWLIQPGHRVGPITAKTTLVDLERLFGKSNVQVGKITGAEGQEFDGVYVFPTDASRKLEIVWNVKRKTPDSVTLYGVQSIWHTVEGVSLGTTLKELEAANGNPFTLAGFGWDYGGTVLSWGDKGKLRERFQKNGSMVVRLGPGENASEKQLNGVLGDGDFSSANPAMQALNPTVEQLTVLLQ